MSGDTSEPPSYGLDTYGIDDPDGKSQSQKIDELNHIIRTCKANIRQADEAFYLGQLSRFDHRTFVRRNVEEVCRELKYPMIDYVKSSEADTTDDPHNLDKAPDFWRRVPVGRFDIGGHEFEIAGIREFLDLADPITVEVTEQSRGGRSGVETKQSTKAVQIPREVSMNALDRCNGFLHHVGMGLELDTPEEINARETEPL